MANNEHKWSDIQLPKSMQWIKNKYIIIIAVFLFWMMFFDQNNFLRIAENYRELRVMQQQKSMLMKKIVLDSLHTEELLTDDKNLEKFAREQYLMKKPNEDVFVIIEK